jgi:tRNA-dihydrouridine synthase
MDQVKIEKVKRNADGDITDVMINGNIYSIDEAIIMAKDGVIAGVNVARAKGGREYLRSDPDGTVENNLDFLPTF